MHIKYTKLFIIRQTPRIYLHHMLSLRIGAIMQDGIHRKQKPSKKSSYWSLHALSNSTIWRSHRQSSLLASSLHHLTKSTFPTEIQLCLPRTCAQNIIQKPFSSAQQSPAQIMLFSNSRSFHTNKPWDAKQTHSSQMKSEIDHNNRYPAFSSIPIWQQAVSQAQVSKTYTKFILALSQS